MTKITEKNEAKTSKRYHACVHEQKERNYRKKENDVDSVNMLRVPTYKKIIGKFHFLNFYMSSTAI